MVCWYNNLFLKKSIILEPDKTLYRLVDLICASREKNNDQLSQYLPEDDLLSLLDLTREAPEKDWDNLFAWLEVYLTYSVNTSHLNFNNRMWSGANLPSILGEMVVALKNTSSCTYESAPVAVLMEQYMINEMLKIIGFDQGEGQMTTGSSNANMIAMMIARNQANHHAKQQGLFGQKPLVAFVNADAHYSFDKAVNILGLGTEQLIKVPNDDEGKINVNALEQSIKQSIARGEQPFFIGATLGTTVRGAFDCITDLLPIRQKYNLWLHGDGAWGGGAMMNDDLKAKLLPDLEQLDSFTMDFHKMLNTALMCNFLLINHQNLLRQTCANGNTDYIFHQPLDLGINSLQCGRRVDSLKWFLDWKFFKKSGFSKRIMHYYQLIDYAQSYINACEQLHLVVKRVSFNLCFHYLAPVGKDINEFNQTIRTQLHQQSLGLISMAYLDDVFVFRLLMTHPEANTTTIDNLLGNIINIGDTLSQV